MNKSRKFPFTPIGSRRDERCRTENIPGRCYGYQYHFSGSKTSVNKDEPFYLTKWVATFVLPPPLQAKYGASILTEAIKSLKGIKADRLPATVEQTYRSVKRRFAGSVAEDGDAIDLEMVFTVNVDGNNKTYPYNLMRDWAKLCYDAQTGFQLLKKDYTGSLTIEMHNKIGDVLKKFYTPILFPITAPAQFDLEYATEGMYELTMTMAAENWTDVIIGD